MLSKLYAGDTIGKRFKIYDEDDALTDPDTLEVNIYNPSGTLEDTLAIGDLIKEAVGTYKMLWDIPTDGAAGIWTIIATATKSTIVNTEKFPFIVSV